MLHLRHADQRVRYERILQQTQLEQAPAQNLLIPIPLELEPLAKDTLNAQLGLLLENGFRIEAFGRNFFRIEAIPTWISEAHAETFIRDLIDQIRQGGTQRKSNAVALETVARLAVSGSYRSDDQRSPDSIIQLAKSLLRCDKPHTSPFGKPTFQEISWSEWARKFGGE
jgi:DNA mismatch repair protein MutL